MEPLSRPWGAGLRKRAEGVRTGGPRSLEVMNAPLLYGASCSASVRADEWGGEADKLGHTNVAFLGNAVKTLEERSWVAARVYNWGRAAPARLHFPVSGCCGAAGINQKLRFSLWKMGSCFFYFLEHVQWN